MLVTGFVSLVGLSGAADASRPATLEERTAMVAPNGFAASCAEAFISTVDPSWGYFAATNAVDCSEANGIVVVRYADGAWSQAFSGSEMGKSTACPSLNVPTAVGRDLGICSAASERRFLPCARGFDSSAAVPLRSRPTVCTNGGRQTSMAELWILKKIRWSTWGGSSSRGRGYKYQAKNYGGFQPRPVSLEAFRLKYTCGAGKPFYTRLRISGEKWNMRFRPVGGSDWKVQEMPAFSYVTKPYAAAC